MRLWLLRPAHGDCAMNQNGPWRHGPEDCAWGFVVRAETEEEARQLASTQAGDEKHYPVDRANVAWTDPAYSTCEELLPAGEPGIIIRDFLNG